MKIKHLFLLVFASFLVFYLSSCGKKSVKNMDKEPNNTIEQAVQLDLDTVPFTTAIQENGDYDWFKIEIPAQGYYSIMASEIPDGIKPQVRFALYQEWEGKKVKDISDWLEFPATMHFKKAGTYYFQIHDDYDDASSKDPITLKTQFTKEFDKYEMNDDIKSAHITNFNQTLSFYIYPKIDVDWFKIKVDGKKGYLKAMIKENYDGINPQIKFYQYNEWADDKLSDLSSWLDFPGAILLPPEGDVYFVIQDDYQDASSLKPYTLKLEFLPQMDTNEPNNDFSTAKEVSRGDTLSLAIFPKGDEDWFKINLAEGDSIKFLSKDWDKVITPQIRLYTLNEETNKINEYSDWEEFPHVFKVNPGTTYYFMVQDDYGDAVSEKPFDIIIE